MHTSFERAARLAAAFTLFVASSFAFAAPSQPFDAKAFEAAQAAGKPIVVEIHADWCAECKAQNRVLDRLTDDPRYSPLVRLRIDYDKQKDLVRQFKARIQSTLVVYKGNRELSRAVGITSEDKIRALVDKAI